MYVYFNPNPRRKIVGDCVIRAVSLALGETWEDVFSDLAVKSFLQCDMPSSDAIWGAYIRGKGFRPRALPDTCPECYTLREFCVDHPKGTFVVKLPEHVVTTIDGDVYDTWDCSDLTPILYYTKEK